MAYWLEDLAGHQMTPESDRSLGPLSQAHDLQGSGSDLAELVLVARLTTGERYELGRGAILAGMARMAARLPGEPKDPRR